MKFWIAFVATALLVSGPASAWEVRVAPASDVPIFETPGSQATVGALPAGKPLTISICMLDGAWCMAGDGVVDATKLRTEAGVTVADAYRAFRNGATPSTAVTGRQNGFSAFRAKIEAGQSARLLVWSDSTGNVIDHPDRWPARFATFVADRYKTHSVDLYLWDKAAGHYLPPRNIAKGSTGATVAIYDFAVSGAVPQLGLGAWFEPAVAVDPDGLILNHGINLLTAWDATGQRFPTIRGALAAAIGQFRLRYPDVPVSMIQQNPNRDDDHLVGLPSTISDAAATAGAGIIDVYSRFAERAKDPSLYIDAIHPGPDGNAIYEKAIEDHFLAARTDRIAAPTPFDFGNIVVNSDFSTWTDPAHPDGWTVVGDVAATHDGDALRLEGGGQHAFLEQQLDVQRLRNLVPGASLCVEKKSTATSRTEAGATLAIVTATGTQYFNTPGFSEHQDGFAWWCISGIDAKSAKSASLRLFPDNNPGGRRGTAWYRAVSLRNIPVLSSR